MGRPPCCDKVGVKKGPWTPEEDIMLVSFVQEHGPANWRSVPTHTGLRRCSKSCRLRWTNYLRPGIKRGCFTDDEEKMIIQLQALLGNKWAAIASYLPERTDNDIKNYWNTHLKKKLKKLQESPLGDIDRHSNVRFSNSHSIPRDQWEKTLQTDINKAKQALHDALSVDHKPSLALNPANYCCSGSSYASSTENIARLLKGWMKNSPNSHPSISSCPLERSLNKENVTDSTSSEGTDHQCAPKNSSVDLSEALESLFGFESFDSSNSDLSQSMSPEASLLQGESKPELGAQFPLSMLENWLFDESVGVVGQGKEDLTTSFSFDENADLF